MIPLKGSLEHAEAFDAMVAPHKTVTLPDQAEFLRLLADFRDAVAEFARADGMGLVPPDAEDDTDYFVDRIIALVYGKEDR